MNDNMYKVIYIYLYGYQKENRCNLKHTQFEDTPPLTK